MCRITLNGEDHEQIQRHAETVANVVAEEIAAILRRS